MCPGWTYAVGESLVWDKILHQFQSPAVGLSLISTNSELADFGIGAIGTYISFQVRGRTHQVNDLLAELPKE